MISSFSGKYTFLSNFFERPFEFKGLLCPTGEHIYQALKATNREDFKFVFGSGSPGQAKRRGQQIKLRPDWVPTDTNPGFKFEAMRQVVDAKFNDPEVGQWLIDTGDRPLCEGNRWGDRIFGTVDGEGENWLGVLLMEKRENLQLLGYRESVHIGQLLYPEVSLDEFHR